MFELTPKQIKCVELMALGNMTQKAIAGQIGVNEKTICDWKKKPEFMLELDNLIKNSIRSSAAKALNVVNNSLTSKDEWVRLTAARDLLSRPGYIPPKEIDFKGQIPIIIRDDLGSDDDEIEFDGITLVTKPHKNADNSVVQNY